jgi:hypothetical protein
MYPKPEELARLRLQGVIEPAKLSPGTIFFVETVKHIFEFEVLANGLQVTSNESEIFRGGRQLCEIAGSVDENGMLFAGMVVQDKHLIISLKNTGRFVTGLILSASLHGKDWSYELWSRKSPNIQ